MIFPKYLDIVNKYEYLEDYHNDMSVSSVFDPFQDFEKHHSFQPFSSFTAEDLSNSYGKNSNQ